EGDGAARIAAEHYLTHRDGERVTTEFKLRHLEASSERETGSAGSYARSRNRARKHRLRTRDSWLGPLRDHRLLTPDEAALDPVPKQQRPDDHGRIAVDEAPDEGVGRQLRRLHVDLHHRGRQQLREPRRSGRGREIE